jgi:signal transduction histidine kinase
VTRRLTISILATLWAILIAGGVVAFFTTRSILVKDLDQTLLMQALISAKSTYPAEFPDLPAATDAWSLLVDDRKPRPAARNVPAPQVLRAFFTDAGHRSMTVRVFGLAGNSRDIIVRLPTDRYDSYMNTMLISLGGFILVTGVIVAGVARAIARTALKPLMSTAETIGAINERSLDRRIRIDDLPEELRPMALRLNDMLERLESSFAARRQFLADASHELRTPVAALVTSLEVSLSRQRTAEQYHEVLQQGLKDAQFLQQLSEGLLEAVRAERVSACTEYVDVSALLTNCCELLRPLAEQKKVAIAPSIAPGITDKIDQRRLSSVMINLISNAVDYNRAGGSVFVTATIDRKEKGDDLVISVRDTGDGIAPEHIENIFEPFYRVDNVRTGGDQESANSSPFGAAHLGLGLSLVRRHVETMNGTIRIASKLKEGTEFIVVLPVAKQVPITQSNSKLTHGNPHVGLIKESRITV